MLELDIFGEDTDEGQVTVGFEVTIDGHDPVPALLLNIGKVEALGQPLPLAGILKGPGFRESPLSCQ
ncbi:MULTISPECIES: hypothetical protein [Pseudarthrobacter]|uniref:hypothetical protein n=1 Tax=Pseudarthrobacter TaxID=1742993 RepID=UPI0013D93C6D|nr:MULTISPECIES: hypothetical protein [Pseudarthrobacter]MDQ0000122.1 hypothetical protein [Pseudarthrobacter sulfonivorans]